MVAPMTPYERAVATLMNEPVDELPAYPLVCGLQRRLLPNQPVTYKTWATDAKVCADSFVEGFKQYKFPYSVLLEDLSVTAHDFGAKVRMDAENTPFVDGHIIHTAEDYEKIAETHPDIHKGRTGHLIEMNKLAAQQLKGKSFLMSFLEGPLLTLTQSGGAEQVMMDMYTDPDAVHKALESTTKFCCEAVTEIATTGVEAMCWDYLWGNYSCLGDPEYMEFEGEKYAKATNEATRKAGIGLAIHNCADMPHLDTQIKLFGVDGYSMAYYPQIPESPTMASVIERGYGEKCTIMGTIDPQLFMRGSYDEAVQVTKELCQDCKTAMCKAGLNSHVCIASGCEVPPDLETKWEVVQGVMDGTHLYGAF